jgi:hypothetical protein
MFILRNALSASTRRRYRHDCAECGADIHRFERYCPFCLSKNTQFSNAVYEVVASCTVADALRICALDQTHKLERLQYLKFSRHRRGTRSLAGCALCGVRFT